MINTEELRLLNLHLSPSFKLTNDSIHQIEKTSTIKDKKNENKLSNENFQNRETHVHKSTTIQELQNVRGLIDKTDKPFNDQKSFFESEFTTPSSLKGKRKNKKNHTFIND